MEIKKILCDICHNEMVREKVPELKLGSISHITIIGKLGKINYAEDICKNCSDKIYKATVELMLPDEEV